MKKQLEDAYDADAERRQDSAREDWKLQLRQKFADLLKDEGKRTLLEIGAADGYDASFFKAHGFDVLATDLSSRMIELCRKRGLSAEVADIYHLDALGRKFDSVYSMNVLLHVPPEDLQTVLNSIYGVLNAGGVFFLGVYGGINEQEAKTDPRMMNLPRFFSFVTDAKLKLEAERVFKVESFELIRPEHFDVGARDPNFHFQAMLLRKA